MNNKHSPPVTMGFSSSPSPSRLESDLTFEKPDVSQRKTEAKHDERSEDERLEALIKGAHTRDSSSLNEKELAASVMVGAGHEETVEPRQVQGNPCMRGGLSVDDERCEMGSECQVVPQEAGRRLEDGSVEDGK